MKKLPLFSLAALMLSLASCKKAYTCECTTNFTTDKMVVKREISKSSKKNAEAICGNYTTEETYTTSSPVSVQVGTSQTNCELK